MSFNISKDVMRISEVAITANLNYLSKRQRTSFNKYLTTGIVKGYGLPAKLARQKLKDMGVPYINVSGYGWVYLQNKVPVNHPFRVMLYDAFIKSMLIDDFAKGVRTGEGSTNIITDPNQNYICLAGEMIKDILKQDNQKLYPPHEGDVLVIHPTHDSRYCDSI